LRQAYLVWQPTRLPQLALQVGRQDFDEAREWLYDENLDAIRLHSQLGPVRTEASFSRRWNVDSPLLKEWRNWILYSEAGVARDWAVGGYVIHRRLPESADDRPVWVGLRSHGRITSGINHWLEISALRGDLGGSAMDAYCVDVGGSVRLHRETRFTVFGGAAYGSGGADPGSRFHQTGLHDNNDKFSGVSSLKYYGELLEPELSNLRIATAGFGFRPSGEISAEVIFHRYSQVHPDWDLGRTNLEVRPLGTSTDIGEEWDLVVGFEEITRVDAEYVFAVFLPGEAFLDGAEKAEMHRFQLKYKF
jgi:alginate production protein